jgi:hypothetical protein
VETDLLYVTEKLTLDLTFRIESNTTVGEKKKQHNYGTEGKKFSSLAGTRTRVSRMRVSYPNHLDYEGNCRLTVIR